ncbi:MAG: hypothetical protein ABII74_08340, partial [Elusimicrobiota bacterium]
MQKAGKILIFVFVGFLITANFAWAGVEHNTSGYAWSENIGWISFNNASDGSAVNYGVNVDLGNGKLSGYGWSENIGWISFNESELVGCPEGECRAKATPSGQLGQSDVNIYGWARALSHGGGWDGWIRFDHGQSNEAYIDSSGNWKGWAWGGEVIGWVSFDQASSNFNVSTDVGGTGGNPLVDPASLSVSEPSSATYCGIARHKFEWLYEDDGNQSQYQIQIDNNSNFNSPEVDLTRSGLSDPPPR